MHIVDRKTFLKLRKGTVFQKYEPQIAGKIAIKGNNAGDNDFWFTELDGLPTNANSDTEEFIILKEALTDGDHFGVALGTWARDGLFENDQLFLIWGLYDIEELLKTIATALSYLRDSPTEITINGTFI